MKIIEWELLKPRNFATIVLIVLIWQLMLAPVFVSIGKAATGDSDDSQG